MRIILASIIGILCTTLSFSQGGAARVAYIDMEYILGQTPEYIEATSAIDSRAAIWKSEIDAKKAAISKLKTDLSSERILLTRELIDEKEQEIEILEAELYEYQQKRFGTQGDLITQKVMLAKPIQEQVFSVVEDITEARKFDYVLDKNTESTMILATKRHDISDLVLRRMANARRKSNMTRPQVKALEQEEKEEDQMALRQSRREEQAKRKAEADRILRQEEKQRKIEQANDPVNLKLQALERKQAEALKLREEKLAEAQKKRTERIEQQRIELERKQAQIELDKQTRADAKQEALELRLQQLQEQKDKIQQKKQERDALLLEEQQQRRDQIQSERHTNKSTVDVEAIKAQRILDQQKQQQQAQEKRERLNQEREDLIAKKRQEQIDRREKAQEEIRLRKERIAKEIEQKKKETEQNKVN